MIYSYLDDELTKCTIHLLLCITLSLVTNELLLAVISFKDNSCILFVIILFEFEVHFFHSPKPVRSLTPPSAYSLRGKPAII